MEFLVSPLAPNHIILAKQNKTKQNKNNFTF